MVPPTGPRPVATSPTTDDAPTRLAITMAVANQLSSTLEIRDHLGTLPKLLVPYLGDFVIVSATDEHGEIVDVGCWHVDPDHRDEVERYSLLRAEAGRSETLGARVIRTGTPIVVDRGVEERTRNDMQPGLARDLLLALAPQAVALLPMLARGRTVGLLSAFAPDPFSGAQLELAHDVAARAALALDNALAYARADAARRSAESAARRLALLAEVGETLAGIEDPDVALGRLARMLVPALGTWSTVVVVDDGGRLRDVGWAHRDPALADLVAAHAAEQSRDPAADSTLSTCLRTGEVVRRAADGGGTSPLDPGTAATVTIPLVARGKAYGAVTLGSTAPASDDVDLAVEVVRRATPVVDSARAAREVARVAESLQRDLLTVGPVPNHLAVRSRYRPSHASRQVGGDWYDAFALRSGGAVVAIGDVVGHDVAAIAAMAQLRTFVRAFAWAEAPSPVDVLTATDAASAGLGPGVFATAVLAVLGPPRPDGRVELTWSNAGHPPPVVVAADGRVRLLDRDAVDVPLGVAPHRPRHETTRLLAPGDTLVLFTDGLVERRDRDLAVGLAAVVAVLTSLAAEPLDVVLDTLLGTLLSGVGQLDDVAAVAVRVGGERPRPAAPAVVSDDDEVHHLPAGPTASAVARYHVGRFTADLPTGVREDALVLVSELAGNAVRHGAAPIALRLRRGDGGVEVGVRDTGAARVGGPVAGPAGAGPHRESGRGLVIVAGLAARWWVETSAEVGKTVWFRLATAEG